MTLMLTLLCRDEADILESMLRFHLDQGVELIIATDNGSVDGSLTLLQRYERMGKLRLIQEPDHSHDQAVWVTRMARMAADLGADWVINSDADEFWWPAQGNLASTLAELPATVEAVTVERTNFLPPPRNTNDQRPFHQRQVLRERLSRNSLGKPLPPKLIHRAYPNVTVSDGNHGATLNGESLAAISNSGIEILHVPIRSSNERFAKAPRPSNATAAWGQEWATAGATCTTPTSKPALCRLTTTASALMTQRSPPNWPAAS
ncbi:glycosyltransferase family 2 protein [bacterium]|nr:glycosyltransferase family 2 protein [bacterium]